MRILINALSVTTGGGLTSFLNLIPALGRIHSDNEYIVLLSTNQRMLGQAIPDHFRREYIRLNTRNVVLRGLYEQIILPFTLRRQKVDWLYSVGNLTTILAPCKVFLVVENANPYSNFEFEWSRGERLRNRLLKTFGRLSVRRATKVRFLSENSREIVCRKLNIPMAKTCVIPHGVVVNQTSSVNKQQRNSFPERYLLTVTNIGPHKNIHTLLDAFEKFSSQFGYPGSLIIAGAPTYLQYFAKLEQQKQRSTVRDRVVFTGWIEPENIVSLYEHAELFVFPSVEETFGFPVLEAMAHGVPTIVPGTGKKSSDLFLPYEELCGDAACYFDPFDSDHLCYQMQRVINDRSYRERLIQDGKAAARNYRWDDVASTLVEVFRGA